MLVYNPKQFISVTLATARMFLSSELAYRNQIFAWVIADTFQPFILAVLWSSVARGGGGGGISVEQMVTYFFMIAIVSKFTRDYSDHFISNKIVYGEFSKYLVKPFNYLSESLGVSLASKLLRFIIIVPFLIAVYFLFGHMFVFDINLLNIVLFVLSLFIGFLINFLLGNTFALIAFFVKQILGMRSFYENVVTLLSGEVIPLVVMPIWALSFVKVLPFRYSLSFPIEIITGTLTSLELYQGIVLSLVWLVILVVVYKLAYRIAIKKYEAEGI